MSLTDWLFNGAPPPQATTYSSTTTGIPDWLSAYEQGLAAKGSQIAAQPYDQYTGQRNAQLTPDQQAAFQATRLSAGAYLPALGQATDTASGIASGANSPLSAASPYFGQADQGYGAGLSANSSGVVQPYIGNADSLNTVGAAQPALGQASQFANQAGSTNYLPLAQKYTQAGLQQNPLAAASPLIGAASQTFNNPNTVQSYMNPYIGATNDVIAQLGARNLSENVLPAVNSDFISAGQYGGSRNQDFVGRAARDEQQNVLNAQTQNLQQGYGQAANTFGSDQARLAGLASTTGQLGGQQQQALLNSGVNLANVGNQATQAQLAAASAQGNIGQTLGNLTSAQQQTLLNSGQLAGTMSNNDILAQISAAQGLSGLGQAAGQLTNQGNQTQLSAANSLGQFGSQAQGLGLQGAQALDLTGQEQQANTQAGLNTSYQDFLNQQGWGKNQLDWLNAQIKGLPVPTSSQTVNQGPSQYYSPSALSQVAGATIGLGQAGKYGT